MSAVRSGTASGSSVLTANETGAVRLQFVDSLLSRARRPSSEAMFLLQSLL
jgi:hypothetical protein